MSKFQDKVVWVTGASAGIGAALVRAFADAGARIVLSARRSSELEKVAVATELASERYLILPLDLMDQDSFPEKVQSVKDRFGDIDLLVHNAGISQRSLTRETSMEVYRRLMEVNYLGTVALTQAVLPGMLQAGHGHFAVVTSLVGKFGTPMRSGYAASKHALHGFFDTLRAETWREGISVTIVCPGFIRTDVSINALTADGSPQNSMDDTTNKGMDPDKFAQKMLRVIARKKEEASIGGMEVRAVYLKRFFPALFSKLIRKAKVT